MPKILFLSLLISPDGVSTAQLVADLAVGLHRKGCEITVIAGTPHYNVDSDARAKQPLRKRFGGLYFESEIEGVKIIHVPIPPKGKRVYSRIYDYAVYHGFNLFYGLLFAHNYDLIFSTTPPPTIGLNAAILSSLKKVPFIYNIREIFPDVLFDMGLIRNRRIIELLENIEKYVYRKSSAIVVISNNFKREMLKKGIDPAKLYLIPDFTDTDFIVPIQRRNEFSKIHGLNEKFVVQYAGNIGLTQGFDLILKAARELQQYEDIHFLIVGGGSKYEWLESEIANTSSKNITLLPYQPHSIVPLIYATADICLVPLKGDTAKSTIPSKIYTIMAAARAVLVSVDSDSELAWLVNEAGCGWVVEPDRIDALTQGIIKSYEERDKSSVLGDSGRKYAEVNYSRDSVINKYDDLIKSLIAVKPSEG